MNASFLQIQVWCKMFLGYIWFEEITCKLYDTMDKLHIIKTKEYYRAVIGEFDDNLDAKIDLSSVRATPLKSVMHWHVTRLISNMKTFTNASYNFADRHLMTFEFVTLIQLVLYCIITTASFSYNRLKQQVSLNLLFLWHHSAYSFITEIHGWIHFMELFWAKVKCHETEWTSTVRPCDVKP